MADETQTIELRITEEEVDFLQMGLGLFITMLATDIEGWKNKNEMSMEKLFFVMDKKMGAMNLWRKVLISAGADPDDIAEHIANADNDAKG